MLGKMLKRKQNRRGDTIVEVLMSIAIVGAVIAGAYALAAHSLAEGISASEHSQAIKLAEAQVEALKSRQSDAANRRDLWVQYFAPTNPINPPTLNNLSNFCLDNTATRMIDPATNNADAAWKPQYNGIQNGNFTSSNLNATNPTQNNTYNLVCTDTKNAATAKFFINIKMLPNTNTTPSYLVTVKWTPAGNEPTSQTQIYYRF
jgi:type II secretory pathway pseudopilin PulG